MLLNTHTKIEILESCFVAEKTHTSSRGVYACVCVCVFKADQLLCYRFNTLPAVSEDHQLNSI